MTTPKSMNCCPHRRCRKLARRKEATAGQPLSMQAAQLLSPAYFYATSCHILSSSKFTWWLTKKLIALRSRFGSRKLRCASYPAGSTRQPCSPLRMSHRERETERQQEEDAKRCAARIERSICVPDVVACATTGRGRGPEPIAGLGALYQA